MSDRTNLPVLYQNILGSLIHPVAEKAFLWAADGPDRTAPKYRAEAYAREVKFLVEFTRPILAARLGDEGADNLMQFILKRHANWRFGGNQTLWFEEAA